MARRNPSGPLRLAFSTLTQLIEIGGAQLLAHGQECAAHSHTRGRLLSAVDGKHLAGDPIGIVPADLFHKGEHCAPIGDVHSPNLALAAAAKQRRRVSANPDSKMSQAHTPAPRSAKRNAISRPNP